MRFTSLLPIAGKVVSDLPGLPGYEKAMLHECVLEAGESQVGPALGLVLVTTQTLRSDSGGAQSGETASSPGRYIWF